MSVTRSAPEAPPDRWVMLALCATLIGVVSVVWHSFSVFLVALGDHFGWSRAQVSLGFSIFVVSSGLTGPSAGQVIARRGARPVILAGGLILAVGLAGASRMTALWQFYLFFGVVSAVGFSAAGWVPTVTMLQGWFRRRLGAATGLVSAGVGIGIFVLVPAIQLIILEAGWRTAYRAMAVCVLLVVIPVAALVHDGPFLGVRAAAPPAPRSTAAGGGRGAPAGRGHSPAQCARGRSGCCAADSSWRRSPASR
jgi:MFS family permease